MPGPPKVPGFVDHHVHFLATAAARLSVDVSEASTVDELVSIIGASRDTGWIRAWGYDDALLDDRRHPTRADLDRTTDSPVVLHHRSGHVAVLNSAALKEVGEKDHPDGILYDRHDLLGRVPRLDPNDLRRAASEVSKEWAAVGIVAFTDATHTNGPPELELFARWCADGTIRQDVTAMVAAGRAACRSTLPDYGTHVGAVRVGHAKVMPRRDPGGNDDLGAEIAGAHQAGFPVAVHVVEIDVLEAVLPFLQAGDRIEHNALCLPEQIPRIAATGAVVVVNPSFLLRRRRKYTEQLTEVERTWLIPIRSLIDAGITVRAGSDSPVTPARPEEIVAGAMAHPFSLLERVDRFEALRLISAMEGGD